MGLNPAGQRRQETVREEVERFQEEVERFQEEVTVTVETVVKLVDALVKEVRDADQSQGTWNGELQVRIADTREQQYEGDLRIWRALRTFREMGFWKRLRWLFAGRS